MGRDGKEERDGEGLERTTERGKPWEEQRVPVPTRTSAYPGAPTVASPIRALDSQISAPIRARARPHSDNISQPSTPAPIPRATSPRASSPSAHPVRTPANARPHLARMHGHSSQVRTPSLCAHPARPHVHANTPAAPHLLSRTQPRRASPPMSPSRVARPSMHTAMFSARTHPAPICAPSPSL